MESLKENYNTHIIFSLRNLNGEKIGLRARKKCLNTLVSYFPDYLAGNIIENGKDRKEKKFNYSSYLPFESARQFVYDLGIQNDDDELAINVDNDTVICDWYISIDGSSFINLKEFVMNYEE